MYCTLPSCSPLQFPVPGRSPILQPYTLAVMFSRLKSNLTRRRGSRSHLEFSRLNTPSLELSDISYASLQRAEEGRRDNSAKSLNGVDAKDADELWSLNDNGASLPEQREATRLGSSWWKQEMLVDRSLRGMAALTSLFAFTMLIICILASPSFSDQLEMNPNSTSVPFQHGKCKSIEPGYQALKLLINVASTLILGMSNTYQQLATALCIDDIAYMLSKHGDCRVGTNSPFAINYKRNDRLKSWLRWLFLISTSMPIHLLANSLVGTSTTRTTPDITLKPIPNFTEWRNTDYMLYNYRTALWHPYDCAVAFIDGSLNRFAGNKSSPFDDWKPYFGTFDVQMNEIWVFYDENLCSEGNKSRNSSCTSQQIKCVYAKGYATNKECDLVLRMQAALILTGCLLAKAIYMVLTIWYARGQVHGECMTSKGDFHRRQIKHTCHKHCKDSEPSNTGEELGHCQGCERFNIVYNHTTLPWPTLAMKRKRAFLGTLGQTALTQILLLCVLSLGSLAWSITFGISISAKWQRRYTGEYAEKPYVSLASYFNQGVQLKSLPVNRISSEISSFFISNGLQFVYSTIYLLLIYNLTLISMEFDWGKLEKYGGQLRCTIVRGRQFKQSYRLQLPKRVLIPTMTYSVIMHWLLGLSMQTEEVIYVADSTNFSQYIVTCVPNGLFGSTAMLIFMTIVCWRTFSYRREGFIPQMYGSIRVLCASTTRLGELNDDGFLKWGDLGQGEVFRRAGLSSEPVGKIVPNELYS